MQYSITRSETIPFLDSNGLTMQMKNFEIAITITSEPHETLEQCEAQLEETFTKHRDIIAKKIPLLQTGSKRLNLMSEELMKRCKKEEFDAIIKQVKAIK